MNEERYYDMLYNPESDVCHLCGDLDWEQNMTLLEDSPGNERICQYCEQALRAQFPDRFPDDDRITWEQFQKCGVWKSE